MADLITTLLSVQTIRSKGVEGVQRVPGISPGMKDGIWAERAVAGSGRSTLLTGLEGYWRLDGNSDDAAGTAHATPTGITYAAGKLSSGAVFAGTTSKIDTPVSSAFGDFTACAWFICNTTINYQRVLDKAYDVGFWLGRNASNATQWGGGVCETSGPYGIFAEFNPNGNWNHIISIRRGSTHELWANGVLANSNTVTTNPLSTHRLAIGAWAQNHGGANPAQYFQAGTIDEVGIWSRALSVEEIANLYDGGDGLSYPF